MLSLPISAQCPPNLLHFVNRLFYIELKYFIKFFVNIHFFVNINNTQIEEHVLVGQLKQSAFEFVKPLLKLID